MVMRPYQAPVSTAAASYTVIWALRNVEVAQPINPCEWLCPFLLLLPCLTLEGGRTKSVSGQEAEFN